MGGIVGFGTGAAVVGGHYAYANWGEAVQTWLSGHSSVGGFSLPNTANVIKYSPYGVAALGATPGLALGYTGVRGVSHISEDYRRGKSAYDHFNKAKKNCYDDPQKFTNNPWKPIVHREIVNETDKGMVFDEHSCVDYLNGNY